ncbi:MAG: PAS domain S-box protein [Pirellulales bacterium]|nr:PAS domain S-box protein [Pirellulales bacterium]
MGETDRTKSNDSPDIDPLGQASWWARFSDPTSPSFNEIQNLVDTLQDQHRRAIHLLRESEARFRVLYEQAPLGYQSLDATGCLLDVNQAWLDLLGYSDKRDVVGRWFGDFLAPGQQALFRERFPRFKEVGEVRGTEFTMVCKNSTSLLVAIDGKIARDDTGCFQRTHCILHDVTECRRTEEELRQARHALEERVEQRTAELSSANQELRKEIDRRNAVEAELREEKERYRTLVETIPHGIQEVDAEGTVTFANSACRRISGRSAQEFLGARIWEVFGSEDDRVKPAAYFRAVLADQPCPTPYFGCVCTQQGEQSVVRVDWDYKRDHSGRVAGLVAVVTDISQQRHAEEQAQRRLDQLAHVDRLVTMGQVVSGLAHELNQPLSAIANYARACRHMLADLEQANSREMLDAAEQIAEQAHRAGAIVQHLRGFVRRADSHRQAISLDDLAREAASLLEVEMRLHDVELELALHGSLPEVKVDRIQIEQVFINLMHNAVEATLSVPKGHRRVTIRTSAPDPNAVEVAVEDTGRGIGDQNSEQWFQPFYTTRAEGLGLGLAISRSIVESHGGWLKAVPNADRGTTCRFALPVQGHSTGGQA